MGHTIFTSIDCSALRIIWLEKAVNVHIGNLFRILHRYETA